LLLGALSGPDLLPPSTELHFWFPSRRAGLLLGAWRSVGYGRPMGHRQTRFHPDERDCCWAPATFRGPQA
jgi:hypothetical protein